MPGGGGSGETNATSGTTSGAVGGSGMTSVTLDVSGLEPFNPKGEAHNLSQRWKKWKRAFSLYVTGKGVSNDAQKRALLLHVAGMDVQEIYFTLAGEGGDASFEATLKVLDDHFVPKANIPFERHLFRQISQGIGETVDQFVCRLRQRAATCDFGAGEDDYIRDQLIDKCYSSHLRRKFLEKEGTVTLDELLRVARSQEAVDRQLKQYSTDQADNQVNAVGGRLYGNKNPRKAKTCFSCGQEGHFSQDKKCPARGQTCRKCGETGHFKVKCPRLHQLSRTHSGSRGPESSRGGRGRGGRSAGGLGRGGRGRGGRETNLVTGRPIPGEEDKGDFAASGHSQGIVFHWGKEQQTAFEELKRLITQAETLAYFKVGCRTRIIADASPVGLGAVLTQQQGGMWRVVSYASRSLTDVERRYSQTEKEALALVWACERFNMYVSGQSFELETDHKPLERVYSRTSKPCARIERWVLRLQGYDFKVVYRPGKTNIADALSRLNSLDQVDHGEDYDFVRAIAISCIPVALSPTEIEEASYFDEELTIVKSCVRSGDWDRCTLPSYAQVKDELCVYGELLLRGTRIVVPKLLRDRVVRLAHEGHQGIVKTKYRLRSKVWWPGMDKEVEKFCKVCHGCQVTSGFNPPEPMSRVLPPSAPWQDCGADLLGPLPTGESILVVIDYYSRFLEVAILKSTASAKVIEALAPMFARFGFPFSLRTDNTPNANMADHSDGPELVAWKRGQSVCDLVCFDYASCVVL